LKQVELAVLNIIDKEIVHPTSRKRQQLVVPIQYEHEGDSRRKNPI
jgi:hypothetical protein